MSDDSGPLDLSVGDVLRASAVSVDDVAEFDLCSGVVRVWCTMEELQSAVAADRADRTDEQRLLLEALTHESVHLMQAATAGWVYDLVCDQLEIIGKHMAPTGQLWDPDARDAAEDDVAVWAARLDEEFEGVSVRSLLEASAFLTQKRTSWPDLGPRGFDALIDASGLSDEYFSAYRVAQAYVGDEAFLQFPLVAWASLCTHVPPQAFHAILLLLRAKGSRLDIGHVEDVLRDFFRDLPAGIGAGTAANVAKDRNIWHPAHIFTLRRIDEFLDTVDYDVLRLPTRWHDLPPELARLIIPPILPRVPAARAPALWWHIADEDEKQTRQMAIDRLLMLAGSLALFGNFEIDSVAPQTPDEELLELVSEAEEVEMLSGSGDRGQQPRLLAVDVTDAVTAAENIGSVFAELVADPPSARHVAAGCILVFLDGAQEEITWDDPRALDALKTMHARIPYLFYFLSESPKFDEARSFLYAYGVDTGSGQRVATEETTDHFTVALTNAGLCAQAVGDDPFRCVTRHAQALGDPLADEISTEVLSAISDDDE